MGISIEELHRDIEKLEKKYSLSYQEILTLVKKRQTADIPVCIFNDKLGSLECIVKFLKENCSLSIKEISFLTNRPVQPIRTTYNRTVKKFPDKLSITECKHIPINVLTNARYSVLENLVSYLLQSGFTMQQVSAILKRDYKTVWTIYNRIRCKQ